MNASTHTSASADATRRTPGMLFAVALTVAALVALGGSAAALSVHGRRARTLTESGLRRVSTSAELVRTMDRTGAHGVAVLAATAQLGYKPLGIRMSLASFRWPVPASDLASDFRARVSRESWAWVLSRTDIARQFDYLLPSSDFTHRIEDGRKQGYPGIAKDGLSVMANDEGYVRYISDRVRAQGDPLVLIVDASYFVNGTDDELVQRLAESAVRPRLIVLNAATDDPSVTPEARTALASAAARLEGLIGQ